MDSLHEGVRRFVLPPPMIGFFEFSLMRTRGDIDQRLLSELFHQYINVEEDFIRSLFVDLETPLGRVLVQEPVLLSEQANHRALAQVLAVILKLPPLKQALASKQFKSVYLDKLLSRQYRK